MSSKAALFSVHAVVTHLFYHGYRYRVPFFIALALSCERRATYNLRCLLRSFFFLSVPTFLRHGIKACGLWVHPFSIRRNFPFRIKIHRRGGFVYAVTLRMKTDPDLLSVPCFIHNILSLFRSVASCFDETLKSKKPLLFVIPAQAGIQLSDGAATTLDRGFPIKSGIKPGMTFGGCLECHQA
jgi:hypothetical protein